MKPNKSAKKSPTGKPFTGKGDPRNGRGPAPGAPNAGRPPDLYLENLRNLLHSTGVQDRLSAILKHSDPELFLKLWDKAHDKLHPRPPQVLQHTGDDDKPIVIESPRERILSRLTRLAATRQASTAA